MSVVLEKHDNAWYYRNFDYRKSVIRDNNWGQTPLTPLTGHSQIIPQTRPDAIPGKLSQHVDWRSSYFWRMSGWENYQANANKNTTVKLTTGSDTAELGRQTYQFVTTNPDGGDSRPVPTKNTLNLVPGDENAVSIYSSSVATTMWLSHLSIPVLLPRRVRIWVTNTNNLYIFEENDIIGWDVPGYKLLSDVKGAFLLPGFHGEAILVYMTTDNFIKTRNIYPWHIEHRALPPPPEGYYPSVVYQTTDRTLLRVDRNLSLDSMYIVSGRTHISLINKPKTKRFAPLRNRRGLPILTNARTPIWITRDIIESE